MSSRSGVRVGRVCFIARCGCGCGESERKERKEKKRKERKGTKKREELECVNGVKGRKIIRNWSVRTGRFVSLSISIDIIINNPEACCVWVFALFASFSTQYSGVLRWANNRFESTPHGTAAILSMLADSVCSLLLLLLLLSICMDLVSLFCRSRCFSKNDMAK